MRLSLPVLSLPSYPFLLEAEGKGAIYTGFCDPSFYKIPPTSPFSPTYLC